MTLWLSWLCVLYFVLNLQEGTNDLEFVVMKFNKLFTDSPRSTTLKITQFVKGVW